MTRGRYWNLENKMGDGNEGRKGLRKSMKERRRYGKGAGKAGIEGITLRDGNEEKRELRKRTRKGE